MNLFLTILIHNYFAQHPLGLHYVYWLSTLLAKLLIKIDLRFHWISLLDTFKAFFNSAWNLQYFVLTIFAVTDYLILLFLYWIILQWIIFFYIGSVLSLPRYIPFSKYYWYLLYLSWNYMVKQKNNIQHREVPSDLYKLKVIRIFYLVSSNSPQTDGGAP